MPHICKLCSAPTAVLAPSCLLLFLQTCLTHLNLDARHVRDACLCLLLPLGPQLKELDLYSSKVTSKGAHVLAGAYTGLEKLELCGGRINGE